MKKLLTILFLLPALLFSQVPDPLPNTYINDLAGVLTQAQVKILNDSIYAIEKRSSVQIAVVILNNLPSNMAIDEYSLLVGRKWQVGKAGNGLVYVAALNDKKQRLEVAGGLQAAITDVDALHITDAVKPYYKQKDYYGMINILLQGIKSKVDPVAQEQLAIATIEQKNNNSEAMSTLIGLIIILIILFLIIIYIIKPWMLLLKVREEEMVSDPDAEKWKSYHPNISHNLNLSSAILNGQSKGRETKQSDSLPSVFPLIELNSDFTPSSDNSP